MDHPDIFFKQLLSGLSPLFKEAGFQRTSQNFALQSEECWAVINFQKSRWSGPNEKTFYINVGITPKRLMAFHNESTDKPPVYYTCISVWRAEQFGPPDTPDQWTVKDSKSTKQARDQIADLIHNWVIPTVKSKMSEADLTAGWDQVPKDYRQVKAKTVLLAADGAVSELRELIFVLFERFGKGATDEGVKIHLEQLREKFPDITRQVEMPDWQAG